jgi:hypothetical protein
LAGTSPFNHFPIQLKKKKKKEKKNMSDARLPLGSRKAQLLKNTFEKPNHQIKLPKAIS